MPHAAVCHAPQARSAPVPGGPMPAAPSRAASGSASGLPLFLRAPAAAGGGAIQAKLAVNAPGDRFEQQADQVADAVVQRKCAGCGPADPCPSCAEQDTIQRKTAFPEIPDAAVEPEEATAPGSEEAAGLEAEGEATPPEAGKEAKEGEGGPEAKVQLPEIGAARRAFEEPPIQTKSEGSSGGGATAAPAVARGLQHSQGGGAAMDAPVQREMERSFNHDLSGVRIHTGDEASRMNRSLGARAFTHQSDIYFNSGEYQPDSDSGKRLLAHELTHTVQQGSSGDRIQRFTAPEQDVALEPHPSEPNDGAEVTGRMNNRIENDEDVQEGADLDEEERREHEKPERSEVRSESGAIQSTGENRPSVDRGAEAQETTAEQQAEIDEQLQEESPEGEGEAAGGEEGARAQLTPAEAAAQRAEAAEQAAASVEIPAEPQPFQHPRIEAPVDSAGEPLPRNGSVDTQVRGLGYIGEMLRTQGYEMKRHAAEQQIGAWGLQAVLEREREDLANAQEGTATLADHNEGRKEIAAQSHEAHGESVERQQFVASHAPDLAAKADEGRTDSSELASEARSKADQSQSEIPDDEDARADAEQQSGEMGETAQGAESMDQAIAQTGERARQYEQDAATAAEQNAQSDANIAETDEVIAQTDSRIEEMRGMNAASQAQIEGAAAGPSTIRRFARQTAASGDELIAATIVMESELIAIQDGYLSEMAGIESREAAVERQRRAEEEASRAELSPEQMMLIELSGLSEDDQRARIAQLDEGERERLLAALDAMVAETPDEGAGAAAAPPTGAEARRVDTGMTQALMGEQPPDPRAPEIHAVESRRTERVGGVLDVADQNMSFLDEEQQQMLANRLTAQAIGDDIGAINVLQMGKDMLQGLVDPRMALVGAVGGFEKMLGGFASIGNWEAWQRDPLGHLLQVAADITTGLAMIFTSILGLAALITAVMVALTIISWGTLSWLTGPVIGWMGTIMTYAGWGAIITGGLAVYFNYLSYMKNLHDAGTADTARELFTNVDEMKQNASDGFQGAMAVVGGVAGVKMGPKLSSGQFFQQVPRSPGAWARQTVQSAREGIAAVAAAPGRLAGGARALLAGGRQGLVRFRDRIRGFFGRRTPDADVATPHARQQLDADLAEARGQRLADMDEAPRRAEMRETARSEPRRIDRGSEHYRDYDVEIEANGHTYRRRRDGRGWCRFSGDPECFTGDGMPAEVRDRVRDGAPEGRRHVLDDHQRSVVAEIEADLQSAGLGWEEIGVDDVDGFLARYPDPDDGLVALNKRADDAIDLAENAPRRQAEADTPGQQAEFAARSDEVSEQMNRRTSESTTGPERARAAEERAERAPAPVEDEGGVGQTVPEDIPEGGLFDPEVTVPLTPENARAAYMGSTPSKYTETGRAVVARMRGTNPPQIRGTGDLLPGNPNNLEVLGSDGKWYRIDETIDMAHISPNDAVRYWNNEGRYYGARSPQVREFMTDPNNYRLEPRGPNRSAGAQIGEVYLPPEK